MKLLVALLVVALIALGGFTAWRVTTLNAHLASLQAQLDTNAATLQARSACVDKLNSWLWSSDEASESFAEASGDVIGRLSRCDGDAGLVILPDTTMRHWLHAQAAP